MLNGYIYGPSNDGYDNNLPAVGVQFCKGIKADLNDGIDNDKDGTLDELGEEFVMSNFLTYWGSPSLYGPHHPISKKYFYNFLQSIWYDSTYVTYSNNLNDQDSIRTNYVYSGNPITGEGWTEANANKIPGDRRFLMSMGPFTFAPGEIKEFTVAIPWAQSTDGAKAALQKMFDVADKVQQVCNANFDGYTSIKEKILQQNLGKVYPTLVDDVLNIELKQKGNYQIEILNTLGAVMYSETINNNTSQILLSNLGSGIYLYRISNSEGVQTGKIIKN